MSLPITCPMCKVDVEHLLHVFFDCHSASQCWSYVAMSYEMNNVEYAPEWLLNKLSDAKDEEAVMCVQFSGAYGYGKTKKFGKESHG